MPDLPFAFRPIWRPAGTADEPIKPIPEAIDVDPRKVDLGRMLFHDPLLSKDDTVSCASCHDLSSGGDDGSGFPQGSMTGPELSTRQRCSTPDSTSGNWDGRAKTLEAQIDGPVQSPIEMGNLWPEVVAKLYQDDDYPAQFAAIYADGSTARTSRTRLPSSSSPSLPRTAVSTSG